MYIKMNHRIRQIIGQMLSLDYNLFTVGIFTYTNYYWN